MPPNVADKGSTAMKLAAAPGRIAEAMARADLPPQDKAQIVREIRADTAAEVLKAGLSFAAGRQTVEIVPHEDEPFSKRARGAALLNFDLIVRDARDAVLLTEHHCIINPPLSVIDGEEPNPDHNPDDPESPAMRARVVYDPEAALREIVMRRLVKLGRAG